MLKRIPIESAIPKDVTVIKRPTETVVDTIPNPGNIVRPEIDATTWDLIQATCMINLSAISVIMSDRNERQWRFTDSLHRITKRQTMLDAKGDLLEDRIEETNKELNKRVLTLENRLDALDKRLEELRQQRISRRENT